MRSLHLRTPTMAPELERKSARRKPSMRELPHGELARSRELAVRRRPTQVSALANCLVTCLLWTTDGKSLISAFTPSSSVVHAWGLYRSTAHKRIRPTRLCLTPTTVEPTSPSSDATTVTEELSGALSNAPFTADSTSEPSESISAISSSLAQLEANQDVTDPASPSASNHVSHSSSTVDTTSWSGLSKFHLSILSRTTDRQRFVTGKYPVTVTVRENPTRKWLNLSTRRRTLLAETELLVNGTTPSRSLASLDRFLWLDEQERQVQQDQYAMVSLELLAEIHLERPGYVQILDASGAGALAAATETLQDDGGWTLQAMNMLKRLEGSQQHTEHIHDSDPYGRSVASLATNNDRLWVTGFSLVGRQGLITAVDCEHHYIKPVSSRSKNTMLWPNEVQPVPVSLLQSAPSETPMSPSRYQDMLLVCDGFLVPTKDRGGLYIVKNPGHDTEWTVCLTRQNDRWFYHRAVWIDLTGDGRQSILTARCKVSTVLDNENTEGLITSGITKSGELVWLECPKPASIDPATGTPLERDGTVFDPFSTRHLPWKTRVLATGPDVMFAVADIDPLDDAVEVISSNFFPKQVTLHSIRRGSKPRVQFMRTIDDSCGQAFGCILADLDPPYSGTNCHRPLVIDSGSTVDCLVTGDSFSHVLVTSHECSYAPESSTTDDKEKREGGSETSVTGRPVEGNAASPEGGSLFAYQIPAGNDAWKTEPWKRTTVASGFTVNGKLNNMVNPGAPGFVYTFYANRAEAQQRRGKRPLIAVAGDCAESAFIFRPSTPTEDKEHSNAPCTNYKLMAEIKCQATVGSIGIGYDDFGSEEQESGFAKLYVPCFEKDKILVFGLGSGVDDTTGW